MKPSSKFLNSYIFNSNNIPDDTEVHLAKCPSGSEKYDVPPRLFSYALWEKYWNILFADSHVKCTQKPEGTKSGDVWSLRYDD